MDYSTLVQIALGGLLTLGGGFLGQWWGERRAVAREQRDRAHESRVWARTHQKDAYVSFFLKSEELVNEIEIQRSRTGDWETIEAYGGLYPALSIVKLFGSTEAVLASEKMALTISDYGNLEKPEPSSPNEEKWKMSMIAMPEAKKRYVLQVRRDLGLPDHGDAIYLY